MKKRCYTTAPLVVSLLGFTGVALADQHDSVSDTYTVTVTNLTHATPMTNAASNTGTTPPSSPLTLANNVFFGTPNILGLPAACPDANGNPRAGEMLGLWVFATHNQNFKLWQLGQPASRELAMLSQTGRPFFLANALSKTAGVGNVFTVPPDPGFVLPQPPVFPPPTGVHDIVLCPGETMAATVTAQGTNRYLSLAAMIFPTNDGFVGVTGVPLPDGDEAVTLFSPAYDSGSEENDELCGNIPSLKLIGFPFPLNSLKGLAGVPLGAPCPDGSGPQDFNSNPLNISDPANNPLRAEGYVHIHPGIKGVGDLDPNAWNWENPVMKVTIQKSH